MSGTVSNSKWSLYLSLIIFLAACNNEHTAVVIMLLNNYAPSFQLVACINFHATAGPINIIFAHVAMHQQSAVCLACTHAVKEVATRFLVTSPTVKHVDGKASTYIKHVNEVMIYLHQAPSPPSPFLLLVMHKQSVLLIQHVDEEIIISAYEQSMLLIKCINNEANISQSNRPGRSSTSMTRLISQIKHVDEKGGISNLPPQTFGASLHIVIAYRPQ
ncbi:hypothetical protein EDD17DRAFT_1503994 [Pisolithus thermaeus]|nr:hypothetical protein EV401DRAFT_1895997 [Pisolithus croceorrhizus]KAI6167780.1 hypothetical protein EDD17DRAFT_1503994 [Pisolithus thermaeus]